MIYEEYFPQCCYAANQVPLNTMIFNKEPLLKVANDNMENNARIYFIKKT